MNKMLLALSILGASAASFHAVRLSTTQFQQEATTARSAWLAETQLLSSALVERADLAKHVHELEGILNQPQPAPPSALLSALQTNSTALGPELRERLFEELGLSWKSSEEYILMSKQSLRELRPEAIRHDKLTELAAAALAMTPTEREQVEAAMEQAHADFRDWASSHTERAGATGDVVAQYTLPNDPAMTVSNNFAAALSAAIGTQRADIILASDSGLNWLVDLGVFRLPEKMIITRYLAGAEQRFGVQTFRYFATPRQIWDRRPVDIMKHEFPAAFLPVFPNGWADVAKREGFELPPEEPQEK